MSLSIEDCTCPTPQYCEKSQRQMTEKLWTLCQTRPQYRKAFIKLGQETLSSKLLYGPGTELLRMYEAVGVPTCEACKKLAQQMNNWGVAECRKRHKQIIDDIFPRAKEWIAQNMPWTHAVLPDCIEDYGIYQRISSDVVKAVDEAERVIKERREKKLDVYTGEQRKGCGACG